MDDTISFSSAFRITDSVEIKSRTYYSIQHVQSAAYFTRLAYEIEKNYDGLFDDELYMKHRALVTGAIFSAVSFLEATINELFSDTVETEHGRVTELDTETKVLMGNLWRLEVPKTAKFRILEKFQIALALARRVLFDTGTQPYQDVHLLIQLRNDLVHYEPEWIISPSGDEYSKKDIHSYEKKLKGKFSLNPVAGAGNPFYPDKCLGHGCAEWAVKITLGFADQFFLKMGVTPTYDHVRSRLITM